MQITDVRVRKVDKQESKLRAYCSVVIDQMFVIHELRVVEGANGVFVAMPRRKVGEAEFRDLAHPITAEARAMLQKAVLDAYNGVERQNPLPQEQEMEDELEQDQLTA
ncbi:MAG: septation regulator SpoVG [Bacillota bacterium]